MTFGSFCLDDGVVRTEFDGVIDQVVQNLLDLFHIGVHHQSF